MICELPYNFYMMVASGRSASSSCDNDDMTLALLRWCYEVASRGIS